MICTWWKQKTCAMPLSVYYFDLNGEKNRYRKVEKNYSWNQNYLRNSRLNEEGKKKREKSEGDRLILGGEKSDGIIIWKYATHILQ